MITSGIMFVVTLSNLVCTFILLLDTLLYNESMYTDFELNNFYRLFLCSLCLFVLNCFTDDAVDAGLKPDLKKQEEDENLLDKNLEKEAKISPRIYSSFLSKLTYYWFIEFFKTAAKRRSILFSDIWDLEDNMKIEPVTGRFDKELNKEMDYIKKLQENSSKPIRFKSFNAMKVVNRVYGRRILSVSFLKLMNDLITFSSPILLNLMIAFISNTNEPKWHGLLIVIAFVFTSILKNFLTSFYNVNAFCIALNFRSR